LIRKENILIEYLHTPWLANSEILRQAKLKLGKDYPCPIVNHSQARLKALDAWRQIKQDGIKQVRKKRNDKKR
jgi:deoxyribodipyrimidine photo-lyase